LASLFIAQFFPPSLPALGTLWIVTQAEDFLPELDEIADTKLLPGVRVDACGVVPIARSLGHQPSLSTRRDGLDGHGYASPKPKAPTGIEPV
jgi:hypothetical protein